MARVEPKVMRINGVPDTAQVLVLATMKAAGKIEDPIVFTGDVRTDETQKLQDSSDILFHFDPDRNETILM
jgi:hypothetical protein